MKNDMLQLINEVKGINSKFKSFKEFKDLLIDLNDENKDNWIIELDFYNDGDDDNIEVNFYDHDSIESYVEDFHTNHSYALNKTLRFLWDRDNDMPFEWAFNMDDEMLKVKKLMYKIAFILEYAHFYEEADSGNLYSLFSIIGDHGIESMGEVLDFLNINGDDEVEEILSIFNDFRIKFKG